MFATDRSPLGQGTFLTYAPSHPSCCTPRGAEQKERQCTASSAAFTFQAMPGKDSSQGFLYYELKKMLANAFVKSHTKARR